MIVNGPKSFYIFINVESRIKIYYKVVIDRLRIGHSNMSHGYLMHREEPVMCQTCKRTSHSQAPPCLLSKPYRYQKSLEMADNLFEVLRPTQENNDKIITFLKRIDMNNLI